MPHAFYITFFFILGACVGSFLNVVVWRLPRGESLVRPPSRCPTCETPLAWYDNVPVLGWLMLRGRCRYCHSPISFRYPAIEFITGSLFVFYYVMFFLAQHGPCPAVRPLWFALNFQEHWPVYAVAVFAVSALLAASLIDAEGFWIPQSIPIVLLVVGLAYHGIFDRPNYPGSTMIDPRGVAGKMTLGGTLGLMVALALVWTGRLKRSFADGYPLLEVEKDPPAAEAPGWFARLWGRLIEAYRRDLTGTQQAAMEKARHGAESREKALEEEAKRAQAAEPAPATPPKEFSKADIRRETRREMVFLMFPMGGAIATALLLQRIPALNSLWTSLLANVHFNAIVGAMLGALVGGFTVWLTRILGGMAFGREAMGMGDVDLMLGVGAVIGAGPVTVAFFVAPFFGIIAVLPRLLGGRGRELPYGPYLSLGTAATLLYYCDIADWLGPGLGVMMQELGRRFAGS